MSDPITWHNETRRLRDLIPWGRNPRQITEEQAQRLADSLDEFGQVETLAIEPDNELVDGHQRKAVWAAADRFGPDYEVDVRVASRKLTEREKQKLSVMLHKGAHGEWDWDALANWGLEEELLEWGFSEEELQFTLGDIDDNCDADKGSQPNPRELPLDVIYTLQMADCTCCLAVQAGLQYGIQSGTYRLCPYTGQLSGRHEVAFIDNNYHDYDHKAHLKAVRELRPKYVTVRDYMSREQCQGAGIAFYELEQILVWAEELDQFADNVIVIPKVDVLDDIPERYVLGYSVPTSHGGTPLPVSAFAGRRVHLLGGSWREQLRHLVQLGDDVVSLDNNYIQHIARRYAQFTLPNGGTRQLADVGWGHLTNPRYAALALSFGSVGFKVNELYSGRSQEPA